jgi:hypothetical protein
MHARAHSQARPLRLASAEVYTGTCSWTKGFEQWYPPHLRTSVPDASPTRPGGTPLQAAYPAPQPVSG